MSWEPRRLILHFMIILCLFEEPNHKYSVKPVILTSGFCKKGTWDRNLHNILVLEIPKILKVSKRKNRRLY